MTADREGGPRVIVLAAGKGRRMGGPKLVMDVGGRPWWRVQSERLSAAGVRPIWVVARVHADLALPGLVVLGDGDAPMFESVRAGVLAWRGQRGAAASGLAGAGVFVLPIDVPAPGAGVWRAVGEAADRLGRPAAPELGGRHGHPVFLPREWADRAAGAPPGARLDDLLRGSLSYVQVDDPHTVTNLNTPEALAAWLARGGGA